MDSSPTQRKGVEPSIATAGTLALTHSKIDATIDLSQGILQERGELEGSRSVPDRLSRLPSELHAQCFEPLELRDCLVASHVCFSWRAVALGHPWLWNEVHLRTAYKKKTPEASDTDDDDDDDSDHGGNPDDPGCLCHLRHLVQGDDGKHVPLIAKCLLRSGVLPFHLSLKFEPSVKMSKLVLQNMHRFVSLAAPLDYDLTKFWLAFPAPRLTSFECQAIKLPENFNGDKFIQLQRLKTGWLEIPKRFTPLFTLTHLSCSAWHRSELDLRRIFDVFPRLETLTLEEVSEKSLIPLTLSQSLRELMIIPDVKIEPNDLSHFIIRWTGKHSLKKCSIWFPSVLDPVVKFFLAAIGNATFGVTLTHKWALNLIPHDDKLCRVFTHFYGDETMEHLQPLTKRLTHLTLPCDAKLNPMSKLVYPAVVELVIQATDDEDMGSLGAGSKVSPFLLFHRQSALPKFIRTPKLRRLVFRCIDIPRSDCPQKWNLRLLVDYGAPRLDSITFSSSDVNGFDACDWSPLFKFTNEVVYEHPKNPAMRCSVIRPTV